METSEDAMQEAIARGPGSRWREQATRFAMVPLGLLIFAPFVFVLLLALFLCVVMVLRMSPVQAGSHLHGQADSEPHALEQSRIHGTP